MNEVRPLLTPSDDNIHAFLDGRLSAREAAAFAAHVAADPGLRRKVAALWLTNQMIRGLGQNILDEPVPDRLTDTLRSCAAAAGSSSKA
ncbi:hypothetical protein GL4_1403 [Methyloceanibacter caenitepidi]|uniref:Putative zinc-finger domain-containing protein n=1 Tax=Methyloceanibacter caenitepidi TaxID=1384459 RepID=A0A0A8K1U3_9HYPH|nr:hypothetical protein GL4_1403 [Methyloceanibacter caenitepidi]